jgi:hypothetical protein
MIPHPFVLRPGLVVHRIDNGYWFWDGPRSLTSGTTYARSPARSAPGWDLATPGLREAWNAGELSRFHRWDKPAASV